jgi:ArsR family metal-binding transcriptional regulator
MGWSTFFFRNLEEFEMAVRCLQREDVQSQIFRPSLREPAIHVWALSVESEVSSKARETLLSSGIEVLGYYDLPFMERPLPAAEKESEAGENLPVVISEMGIDFIAQCFADTDKIRLIVHHDADIAFLLPYLNSVLKAAQYSPEIPAVSFKKGIRMITIYRDKIGLAKADDLLDVWECLKDVKGRIEWVHEHTDEITPNFDMYTPPCMAFAAAVANGEAEADMCPPLMKAECAEGRNELLQLLGEAP